MQNLRFIKSILYLTFLCLTTAAVAQDYEYVAEIFNKDHGLPDEYVKNLDLDSYGNVWLLTRKGIVKFNGSSFTQIEFESKLPINGFEIDLRDNLWLNLAIPETSKLETDRILIYNTSSEKLMTIKQYTRFDDFENAKLNFLWRDSGHNIFFSYKNGSVFFYDGSQVTRVFESGPKDFVNRFNINPASLSYANFGESEIYFKNLKDNSVRKYIDKNAFLYIWQDDKIKFKCHFEDLKRGELVPGKQREISLVSVSNDTLFQGVRKLFVYDIDKSNFFYVFNRVLSVYNMEDRKIEDLSELLFSSYGYMDLLDIKAKDNVVWIASTNGLIRIEKKKKVFQPIINNNNLSTREMMIRSEDTLLVNTEYGFYIINHKTNEVLDVIDPEIYFYGLTDIGNDKFIMGNHGRLFKVIDIGLGKSENVKFFKEENGKLVVDIANYLGKSIE